MDNTISWISLAFSLLAGGFSLFTYISGVRHDRKEATLNAFNTLQNEVFDKLNLLQPAEIAEIAKHNRSEEYKTVSGYIARIEHFAVGVKMKIYDRETVYKLAHGYLDGKQITSRIEPIIGRKQANADEDYFENIHWLLDWMRKHK